MNPSLVAKAHAERLELHVAECEVCREKRLNPMSEGQCVRGDHLVRLRDHHAAIAAKHGDRSKDEQAPLELEGEP
ncbi:MAG TPA: hypothetical protein VFG76_07980 [Candidatus Polarisedimenticolia bacterium]|nr:hypothetical protein [Candidatus Polarisedimenticolia bacterium]